MKNKEIPDSLPEHLEKARNATYPKFMAIYCSKCRRTTTHTRTYTYQTEGPFSRLIKEGYRCNLCYPQQGGHYSTTPEMRERNRFGNIQNIAINRNKLRRKKEQHLHNARMNESIGNHIGAESERKEADRIEAILQG